MGLAGWHCSVVTHVQPRDVNKSRGFKHWVTPAFVLTYKSAIGLLQPGFYSSFHSFQLTEVRGNARIWKNRICVYREDRESL